MTCKPTTLYFVILNKSIKFKNNDDEYIKKLKLKQLKDSNTTPFAIGDIINM